MQKVLNKPEKPVLENKIKNKVIHLDPIFPQCNPRLELEKILIYFRQF